MASAVVFPGCDAERDGEGCGHPGAAGPLVAGMGSAAPRSQATCLLEGLVKHWSEPRRNRLCGEAVPQEKHIGPMDPDACTLSLRSARRGW
jgi:hypothetical protein